MCEFCSADGKGYCCVCVFDRDEGRAAELRAGAVADERKAHEIGEGSPSYAEYLARRAEFRAWLAGQEWRDCGEGPFENEQDARDFAEAECGVEWRVVRRGRGWVIQTWSEY